VSGTLVLLVASPAVLVFVAVIAWRAADRAVTRVVAPPASADQDSGARAPQRRSSANATPGPLPRA
jgi:hypothetical protein